MDSAQLQGAAKHVTEIMEVFELFLSRELIDMIVKETDTRSSFFTSMNYQPNHLRACQLTEGESCVVLGLSLVTL
jgi:hypothetical protein